jgi:hypothetical protein
MSLKQLGNDNKYYVELIQKKHIVYNKNLTQVT